MKAFIEELLGIADKYGLRVSSAELSLREPALKSTLNLALPSLTLAVTACGCWVPPEDPRALAEAILDLKNQPEQLKRYGSNGRKYVPEHYSRESQTSKYYERKALDLLLVTAYSYKMTRREKLLTRAMNNPKDLSFGVENEEA